MTALAVVISLAYVLADVSAPGWLVVVVLALAGVALALWIIRALR